MAFINKNGRSDEVYFEDKEGIHIIEEPDESYYTDGVDWDWRRWSKR